MMSSLLTFLVLIVASFFILVSGQVSENITISPLPTLSTCQIAIFTWTGGKGELKSLWKLNHSELTLPAPYRAYIYPEGWTNQTDWM